MVRRDHGAPHGTHVHPDWPLVVTGQDGERGQLRGEPVRRVNPQSGRERHAARVAGAGLEAGRAVVGGITDLNEDGRGRVLGERHQRRRGAHPAAGLPIS